MSDYIRQNGSETEFSSEKGWIILSPIEQSIKCKIEKAGKPLKDWDINIYRGVLTGCNDAFIIDGVKREEILANCKTSDEKKRTAELIRPILRGRDIKRYGYDFANLYLITTHNGYTDKNGEKISPIDIKEYPAVKKHFDEVGEELKKKKAKGKGLFDRDDQGITPYNLRNCAYMEDFSQQKIVWKRIGSILRFSYDNKGCLCLDSTCFASGKHIEYLVAVLNSKMGHYLLREAPKTGTGDLLISVQAVEPLKIPILNDESEFYTLVNEILRKQNNHQKTLDLEEKIDRKIYKLYGLSNEEIAFIQNDYF